jgi:hypothetical protein
VGLTPCPSPVERGDGLVLSLARHSGPRPGIACLNAFHQRHLRHQRFEFRAGLYLSLAGSRRWASPPPVELRDPLRWRGVTGWYCRSQARVLKCLGTHFISDICVISGLNFERLIFVACVRLNDPLEDACQLPAILGIETKS